MNITVLPGELILEFGTEPLRICHRYISSVKFSRYQWRTLKHSNTFSATIWIIYTNCQLHHQNALNSVIVKNPVCNFSFCKAMKM